MRFVLKIIFYIVKGFNIKRFFQMLKNTVSPSWIGNANNWLLESIEVTGCKKSALRSTGRTRVLTKVAILAKRRKKKDRKIEILDVKANELRFRMLT